MIRRALRVCGVVSSVLYVAADIVAALRYPSYSYKSQVISELLAAGSPTRPFMIATAGIPYNVLVALFPQGWHREPRRLRAVTPAPSRRRSPPGLVESRS